MSIPPILSVPINLRSFPQIVAKDTEKPKSDFVANIRNTNPIPPTNSKVFQVNTDVIIFKANNSKVEDFINTAKLRNNECVDFIKEISVKQYQKGDWQTWNLEFTNKALGLIDLSIEDSKEVVEHFQKLIGGVEVDGKLGPETFKALTTLLNNNLVEYNKTGSIEENGEFNKQEFSEDGLSTEMGDFILGFEITNESVYEENYKSPQVPGVESGITIGVGYDLKYNDVMELAKYIGEDNCLRLRDAQRSLEAGESKESVLSSIKDIEISFATAKEIFKNEMLPKYVSMTKEWLGEEHFDKLPGYCKTAIVSLVFNRGTSEKGRFREEMSLIRKAIQKGDLHVVSDFIKRMNITMASQWAGYAGLFTRREQEADLFALGAETVNKQELLGMFANITNIDEKLIT